MAGSAEERGACNFAALEAVDPALVQRSLDASSLLAQHAAGAFATALTAGHWQVTPFMLSSMERQTYALLG